MTTKIFIALITLGLVAACSDKVATDSVQNAVETAVAESPLVIESVDEPISDPDKLLTDQNTEFEEYKEHFLQRIWELYPSHAVYQGYYKYDDQLKIPNGEVRALRRTFYVNQLQSLRGFDATKLSSANATDLNLMINELKSSLWYLDEFREYEWNPAKYNVAGTFGVILNTDYKPLKERLRSILTRLDNVPAYYQAAKQNLKKPTLPHLGLALQQSKGALGMFETSIPAKLEGVDFTDEESTAFTERLSAAVGSINDYISWLETLRVTLGETGARNFRVGPEIYEKKFAHDIVSNYTAKELYDIALLAKAELHKEMVSITKGLWSKYFADQEIPSDNLVAVKQMIDHLAQNHIQRDKFVDEIRRQIPIIQKFVDDNQLVDSDPTRPLLVRLTPEYQRGFAGASVNAPGPYDATANTYYNVSPLDDFSDEQAESYLREYNHWILQILNIHEAIPGHYTQLMHANKSPSKIKSIFGNGAMIEGWAVYSERMMLEAGYANNEPEMWLMYSKWNLRVVVNAILDYSIQVLGMEREQALDMLINEAFQERIEAEGKWRRATVSQVQLTSYFTGYSEIYAFREELKKKLADKFDLKAFHNQFLSYGNAPVPLIRELMLEELGLE